MLASEYRLIVEHLGLSYSDVGVIFGANSVKARKWASGQLLVPKAVSMLLRLLMSGKITLSDIVNGAVQARRRPGMSEAEQRKVNGILSRPIRRRYHVLGAPCESPASD